MMNPTATGEPAPAPFSPSVRTLAGGTQPIDRKKASPDLEAVSKALCQEVLAQPLPRPRLTTSDQSTDAEVINLCLRGDREAWAALLERYTGLIYSIAWKSNLPPEDVADVFQSVVLALLEDLGDLRDGSKLSSWLTSVTVHECMRVKRRRLRPVMSVEEVSEAVANIPDESSLPDVMMQRLEQQQLVRQALTMVDEPCRRLLTRLFYEKEEWSYEDIAGELGLSASTIGPKRSRCLKKLLRIMTELGL